MKLTLLFLLFSPFVFWGQDLPREVLYGRIVADSMDVNQITIVNKNTNLFAISNDNGNFSIKARVKDTLVFRGLSFNSLEYVLKPADFKVDEFIVKLETKINDLNEVVISPNSLTGIVEIDTKRLKVYGEDFLGIDYSSLQYENDKYSKVVNPIANAGFSELSGIDFVKMGEMFVSKKKKEMRKMQRAEGYAYENRKREVQAISFSEHLYRRYSYNFFTNDLKIAPEDLTSFIAFAEPGLIALVDYLKPENEIKFIDYLIDKSNEFKRNKILESTTNKK
ncbi:MAG: carboxypeptidase-like regulatory domain-containing protein [Flavobacterium sp.]|nr:carboxypeptidase-like regulatory domain-containing protein [Flavobacterium sp.]